MQHIPSYVMVNLSFSLPCCIADDFTSGCLKKLFSCCMIWFLSIGPVKSSPELSCSMSDCEGNTAGFIRPATIRMIRNNCVTHYYDELVILDSIYFRTWFFTTRTKEECCDFMTKQNNASHNSKAKRLHLMKKQVLHVFFTGWVMRCAFLPFFLDSYLITLSDCNSVIAGPNILFLV